MVRLPLIINGQRLKTLEGLRENFNLTELLERFRGGQLRAWLNCWDFDSELEQVEALSPDLPKQELLEALCRIFGVEGEAKEQALAAFKEEQEKREEETKRRKKQQEAEERAKISVAKPLTLDEIEFDWQEGITLNKESLYDINVGEDRFFALSDYNYERISIYSYDGIHWEPSSSCINSTMRTTMFSNGFYIITGDTSYQYSRDAINWSKEIIIDDELVHIRKILWTGSQYVALGEIVQNYHYTESGTFLSRTKSAYYNKPVIYVSDSITGPWHKESIGNYCQGDLIYDIIILNGTFCLGGEVDTHYAINTEQQSDEDSIILYTGHSFMELKRSVITGLFGMVSFYRHKNKCFFNTDEGEWGYLDDVRCDLISRDVWCRTVTDCFIISSNQKHIHISVDGINWRKLNAPLQNGKMAYLDGKLLIADGNKIAVGTLKIAHKDNTSSCSTQSSNTSTEDRDLHYNVELSAEEAKTGTIKEVTVTRSETCSLCSGSGRESGSGERSCTNCNGCGLVQGSKSIKVRIPADVKSGAKLRVQGQGNAGRGEAQPGDLYVHITVREESSIPPSQTNSVDHTTSLKEIADAMNPLKNPSVLISPTDSIAKLVATMLKSGMISEEGKNK